MLVKVAPALLPIRPGRQNNTSKKLGKEGMDK